MPKHRVIDADGHVMETHPDAVQWRDAMGPAYQDRAPRYIPFPTGGGRMFLEGKIWFEPIPGIDAGVPAEEDNFAVHSTRPGTWDPHVRIEDMDLDGIDQAVLFGGVLDRFPRLRVGIMEGYVGWLPFWLNRMDSQYEKFGKQVPAKLTPSEYVESGRVMVTCDYDETTLPQVVDALGAGNILYASDYWHIDAKFPGTVEYVAGRHDLSGEAKGRILGENAAELFKL